jgi:hypothetical protein
MTHTALLAELVLALHLAFVLFAACGGLLLRRRPRIAWLHLPAVLWAAAAMFTGWICPLTWLEASLRGESTGGLVERLVAPLLYPAGLTRRDQLMLGLLLLAGNIHFYRRAFFRISGSAFRQRGTS